jgi:putative transcriptional regulator
MVRFELDPNDPPELGAAERARLVAETDAELTAAAEADTDNPPLTADELGRLETARAVRQARAQTGLTQAKFADTYRISLGRLRDLEQGRTQADGALLAYLTVIQREPEAVARALGQAPREAGN